MRTAFRPLAFEFFPPVWYPVRNDTKENDTKEENTTDERFQNQFPYLPGHPNHCPLRGDDVPVGGLGKGGPY